jgi:hypothetical protein
MHGIDLSDSKGGVEWSGVEFRSIDVYVYVYGECVMRAERL